MTNKLRYCKTCKKYYSNREHFNSETHLNKRKTQCTLESSAFKNNLQTYIIKNFKYTNIDLFFKKCVKKYFIEKTSSLLRNNNTFKVNIHLLCKYKKIGQQQEQEFNFKTRKNIITKSVNLQDIFEDVTTTLKKEMIEFEVRGSGWTLTSVETVQFRYAVYQPIKGSSYIPLPDCIKSTKSVINFQNSDNLCFKYAVLSKHIPRIWSQQTFLPYLNLYNFSNLTWPVGIDDINIFEKNNNVSIHVFFIDDDSYIKPYRLSKKVMKNHFDLLLLTEQNNSHYTLIKNSIG